MRNPLVVAALVAVVAVVAGCGGGNNPGRTLYVGGAVPPLDANLTYHIQSGAGIPDVMLGSDAGYFITANQGGAFRLVWTGDVNHSNVYRHFTGSVWTQGRFDSKTDGCLGQFCALQSGNFVSSVHDTAGGQRVDWDTFATNGLEGFDFTVTSVPAIFNFIIDGRQYTNLVYFPAADNGGQISSTGGFAFGLIPLPL